VCVRVARNIAQETESIERDDINMRANAECWQGLRQCAAGMCHTAYRQHPAIRGDALRLECNAVGSGQLYLMGCPLGVGCGQAIASYTRAMQNRRQEPHTGQGNCYSADSFCSRSSCRRVSPGEPVFCASLS